MDFHEEPRLQSSSLTAALRSEFVHVRKCFLQLHDMDTFDTGKTAGALIPNTYVGLMEMAASSITLMTLKERKRALKVPFFNIFFHPNFNKLRESYAGEDNLELSDLMGTGSNFSVIENALQGNNVGPLGEGEGASGVTAAVPRGNPSPNGSISLSIESGSPSPVIGTVMGGAVSTHNAPAGLPMTTISGEVTPPLKKASSETLLDATYWHLRPPMIVEQGELSQAFPLPDSTSPPLISKDTTQGDSVGMPGPSYGAMVGTPAPINGVRRPHVRAQYGPGRRKKNKKLGKTESSNIPEFTVVRPTHSRFLLI